MKILIEYYKKLTKDPEFKPSGFGFLWFLIVYFMLFFIGLDSNLCFWISSISIMVPGIYFHVFRGEGTGSEYIFLYILKSLMFGLVILFPVMLILGILALIFVLIISILRIFI
jgi:hypothetical protein